MTRPYKPNHIPGLMPFIVVQNFPEALSFYREAFQFELRSDPIEQNNELIFAELNLLESVIMIAKEGAWGSLKQSPKTTELICPMGLYVYVKDVNTFFENAKNKGATVLQEPEDQFWGDRMCRLRDLDGYDWSFSTHTHDFDPSKIPTA